MDGGAVHTVYAYLDKGPMAPWSRWKPRKVCCTTDPNHGDAPGQEHVVKFQQGQVGAAALVSEVVGTGLLVAGGVRVLEMRLVHASQAFAASYATKLDVPYAVAAGLHFGTLLRTDVENGPPSAIAELAEPQEVIDLWAFDSWLCNTDRTVEGNILMTPASMTTVRLIAADHSDCFGGAGRFADGSWKKVLREQRAAQAVSFLDRAIFQAGGGGSLQDAICKVRQGATQLTQVIAAVPDLWWQVAAIQPQEVIDELNARLRRIEDILGVKRWEGLADDIQGGRRL